MIPQKAIKKFTKPAHREIVVGHLIAYGFFPQTSDGIDQAKKFVDGLDQWIAPSDLPNYYNDIESDLMTGKETAGIRNIKMILEDFYFGGGGSVEEPQEIPVEMEIVEVEQKDPDEPIVITVEAPFENPVNPKVPRRIRLPRIKNTIKVPQQKKKDTATRMAEAFDRNLDNLLDNIRNPDPGSPPRVRKKKQTLVKKSKKIRASFKNTEDPWKAENLSAFIGLKIKKSFGRAAEARRLAKESGAEEQGKGYFLKKALKFEFGGDRLGRLQGTFSKSPVARKDPALNADQRFLAGIEPDLTPPEVKQGTLFDTNKYTTKTGVAKVVSDGIDRLKSSFDRVDQKFRTVIEIKKSSVQSDLSNLSIVVEDLKKAILKNVDTQKDITDTKEKQLELLYDITNEDEAAAKAAEMSKQQDLSGNLKAEDPYKVSEGGQDGGGGSPLDWLKNLKNLKWLRRLKNPMRTMRAMARLGRMRVGGLIRRIPGLGKFKMPSLGLGRGVGAAQGAAQASRGGGLLSKAGGLLSKIPGRGLLGAAAKSPIGKFAGRLLPGANIAIGGALTASRLAQGDYLGAALSAGSMIPGPIGWAFLAGEGAAEGAKWLGQRNRDEKERKTKELELSLGIGSPSETSVMTRDGSIPKLVKRDVPWWEKMNPFKMSEGGVVKLADGGVNAMIGEAGPEMLLRNGMGAVNPLQSLAPMILAAREVTKRAGTWADPIENFVRQTTDPIAKSLNLPVEPIQTDIGKGQIPPVDTDKTEDENGIFGWLKKLFEGGAGEKGKRAKKSDNVSPVDITGIPLGQGETAKAGELVSGLVARGFTREEASAIVGNLWAESGFNTGAVNPSSGAYGLMQWLGGRKDKLISFAQQKNKPASDLDVQLDYIAWELKGGNQYESAQFQKAMSYGSDIASKTRGFAMEVERAGAHELQSSMAKRVGAGQSAFNASVGTTAPPAPVAAVPPPAPPQPLVPPQQPASFLTLPSPPSAAPAPAVSPIFSGAPAQKSAYPTTYNELRQLALGVR